MSITENPTVKWFQSWPRWAALLVTGIVYLVLAELGLLSTFDDSQIATVWPATGFALAAMLLLGYRIWPALTVAAFLASAVSYGVADAPVPELLLASLLVTAGSILPVMLSVYLLRRFTGMRNPFDRVVDVFKYLFLAGLVSTAIGATIGVTGVSLAGFAEWSDWGSLWLVWWMGAASSNLIIAPLILVWILEPRIELSPLKVVETVLSLAAFIGSMVLITMGSSESGESSPLIGILIFPLLFSFIWASVRFGHRGATVILAVFWVMLVWMTYVDPNTRTPRPMHEAVMIAQFYMVVIAALTLVPAAMIKERRKTESNLIEAKEDIERGSAELFQANLELKREIAERKRTQVELERSNRELQQFAYVASHDLQEPLRMVASFVQLLEEGYADKLDDKAREFIGFSVEGVTRMQKMIDDLLDYSRVGTRGVPLKPVDTEAALAQAMTDLRFVIADSGAEVTHDPLPGVEGDQLQIAQVFQNLINNGIRFRGPEPPRLHIAAVRKGGFWEFSVRDNGMGIDPKYFDRIFVIFQRLNKRRDYPGTGIGLALCKRIVERHGGDIRVESAPGRGATFYFTIPASGGEQT